MDQATLLRGKPGKITLAGAAFLLLVAIPYLFAHFRQGQRAANRGESTVKVERKNFGQVLRLNGTTQASRSFVVLAPKLEGAQVGSMVITKLVPAGTHAKKDTAMKQAEDELKRAELELQRNEIVSRIDAEKNQEALDEAQVTLKQLKQTYELKRAASASTIRIQEIQRDRALEA